MKFRSPLATLFAVYQILTNGTYLSEERAETI